MTERIFVGVAWPYANGPLHLGHVAGAYLAADIFARFHRLRGNQVLMVSGSDQHGTPVTLKAAQEGTSPREVVRRYHSSFIDSFKRLGISFDLFTSTGTENHARVVQDIFLALLEKGHIYLDKVLLPFCLNCKRFLPDRYVEGTCPHCHAPGARGDQCDACGKPLNPSDLIDFYCGLCGRTPEIRETEHFFLKLTAFEEQLKVWVQQQKHWRPNVYNFTMRYLADGLRDRAITRDIEWDIPVPLTGYEDKRIYVWFEAVIGYLSASREWAARRGDPEGWRPYWERGSKSYYFIGKDNIVFHTVIWPAILKAYNGLSLPYDVPANEFLTLRGKQLSTSRNWAVWLPDYLDRYPPDPLRYLLSANMPETGDTDFSWREYVRRNNDELVATYGNLVHRVLTFVDRHFGGVIPETPALDEPSTQLVDRARATLDRVAALLSDCHFRDGIREAMSLSQEANRYLDSKAPWKAIKDDPASAAVAVRTTLAVISCLKTVFYPFLPFSSAKLHHLLGCEGDLDLQGWSFSIPPSGKKLPQPQPLFSKLDESVIEEEDRRLEESVVHA